MRQQRNPTGVRARHSRNCATRDARRCRCKPTYEAWTYDARDGKKIRKTFPIAGGGEGWRADATSAFARGTLAQARRGRYAEAAADMDRAGEGRAIRHPLRARYKPSDAARSNEHDREQLRATPTSARSASATSTASTCRPSSTGSSPTGPGRACGTRSCRSARSVPPRSTARGRGQPDRGLRTPRCRHATRPGRVPGRGREADRSPPGGRSGPVGDRLLRRASSRRAARPPLPTSTIDLRADRIHVQPLLGSEKSGWSTRSREGDPRPSRSPAVLRRDLLTNAHASAAAVDQLVFGRTPTGRSHRRTVRRARSQAWEKAKLTPITLHECRHTFVTLMLDGGGLARTRRRLRRALGSTT